MRLGLLISIVLLWATLCTARLAEEQHAAPPAQPPMVTTAKPVLDFHCFHVERDACPARDTICRCKRYAENVPAVVCCDVKTFQLTEGLDCAGFNQGDVALHIINASIAEFSFSEYKKLTRLTSLSITDGNITQIKDETVSRSSMTCLNISNNHISTVEQRGLVNLINLKTLDLSYNNLTTIPNFRKPTNTFTIDIVGNNEMQCKSVLEAMNKTGSGGEIVFKNANSTVCLTASNFQWFNSTEQIPLKQVEMVFELEEECKSVNAIGATHNCSCEFNRWNLVRGDTPTMAVAVDCSGRGLTELPKTLPPNTVSLNVSYNNITSLTALSKEPSYEKVSKFIANDNQIISMLELEGTKFIDIFAALNLKNNKLKSIPWYILSNSFDRKVNRIVYLGGNRIHCDCNSAKNFKIWLLGKRSFIPDYDEILCNSTNHILEKVIELAEAKYCSNPKNLTDYIYYIIAAEVLLLVCLILKVSYDYWVFKTAGYLPWPANKMPKLPCDWLCET